MCPWRRSRMDSYFTKEGKESKMAAMEITGDCFLRPSSPHHLLHQHVPLSIFDRAAINAHIPILFVYCPPTLENSAIKEALGRALSYFPHLAGHLGTDNLRRPTILLNDAGTRVIETQVNSTLQETLPLLPTHEVEKLIPKPGVEEVLQVQLNRYSCGGLVVGLTLHHRVADGQAMNTFLIAWARLVNGLELDRLPYHDRAAIAILRNPKKIKFDHYEIEFGQVPKDTTIEAEDHVNVIIRYSVDFIFKLKARIQARNPKRRCSTFVCLLTHVWKKVTVVRKLALEESTKVKIAVDGRTRINPAVPKEYFGNLVLWAYPKMTVQELLSKSYEEVADVIHEAVSRVDDEYFKSFVHFGRVTAVDMTSPEEGKSWCPDMELDSWLSFEYDELDFGGGPPVQVLPYFPQEGLGFFLCASDEKGAVDFHVVLLPHQVDAFKRISHDLD